MMKEEPVMFSAPPRLLLGVAFLFWGAMHDRPLSALVAAVLMEGRHWTNLRWPFGEMGFARSWQLSVLILIILSLALMQVEDRVASDFLNLLSWLPFIMMPLALAQQYSSDRGVPMTTFSFIARRKLAVDRKAGREVSIRELQLGYPYFFLILIVAGMDSGKILTLGADEVRYAVGISVLLGWGLFQMGGSKGRKGAWGVAYLASLLMALGMSWGVISAYQYFVKSLTRPSERAGSPFEAQTSIGQVGKLKLSPAIVWRYFHEEGKLPDLVRVSSYNWPEGDVWMAQRRRMIHRERISEGREAGGGFEKFLRVGEDSFLFHEEDREVTDYETQGAIVGMVSNQSLIPHPMNTKRLEQVSSEFLTANAMGAIQLNEPRKSAMKVRFYADRKLQAVEHDPWETDLICPSRERVGLDRFLRGLLLNSTTWNSDEPNGAEAPRDVSRAAFQKIRVTLGEKFLRDFKYTVFLEGADLGAPMSKFLNEKKEGHCEYFAGSTALLLRRMGVPSRYVVGFAVREEGGERGEYLLRGKHAHAWAQAYVGGTWRDERKSGSKTPIWRCRGGRWVDVDLTPPDWLSEYEGNRWFQGGFDWFQKSKTSLVMWFSKSSVSGGFKILVISLGSGFLIYLFYKMIRTRKREGRGLPGSWEEEVRKQGLLRDFERWLSRRVGHRPAAMPMATWLRSHLPQGGAGLVECYEAATFHPDGVEMQKLEGEMRTAKKLWKEAQKTPGT
jgi:hypothetical protein